MNPAVAWSAGAAAIVAAPIIIHLINRLRYKKVRFAAMEFLLASQQQNKRRVLIEQLILLLCRIIIILLIIALISRFTADASTLAMFQDAAAHHVVVLDDSGSMLDRSGESTAFDQAREVIKKLVVSGSRRKGEKQKFTLILLSEPDDTLAGFSERNFDDNLPAELTDFLDGLDCTVARGDMAKGIESARSRLVDDKSAARHLHIISDFRNVDWVGDSALAGSIKKLDEAEVHVNLVRSVGVDPHANLSVVKLNGDLQSAAEGVLTEFHVSVTNHGAVEAKDVPVYVALDGTRLPLTERIESIAAGESENLDFYVVPNGERLEVSVEEDALDQDNVRYLGLDVPESIPVLIIDGTSELTQGRYIADALAANPRLTGIAAIVDGPDYLRKFPLDNFHSIFLINVPNLAEDAVVPLERYVAEGGGISWFLGDQVQPQFYNERLYLEGKGIFPVRLSANFSRLPHPNPNDRPDDIVPQPHPIIDLIAETPFLNYVIVNAWHGVDTEWWAAGTGRAPTLNIIANLRNQEPFILEHRYGPEQSRVVTFLSAAGPLLLANDNPADTPLVWNNWATGDPVAQGYVLVLLELQSYIARRDRIPTQPIVGEPIVKTFQLADYEATLEIEGPDGRVSEVQAAPLASTPLPASGGETAAQPTPPTSSPADPPTDAATGELMQAIYRETMLPGVYQVRMSRQDGEVETTYYAYNVPAKESELLVATDEQLRTQLGETKMVEIRDADSTDWFRSDAPGNELRTPIILALLLMLILEQFLAYRFSYHATEKPRAIPATA